MDYIGLFYLSVFSAAWLFGLKDHIESKEKWYLFFLSVSSGILIISSVVLTWPESMPQILKNIWKFVLVYIIVAEIFVTKYELKILPKRMKEKEGMDIEMDNLTIGFSLFIGILLFAPGFYYGYKLAFL